MLAQKARICNHEEHEGIHEEHEKIFIISTSLPLFPSNKSNLKNLS